MSSSSSAPPSTSTLVVSTPRAEQVKGTVTRAGTAIVRGSLLVQLRTLPPATLVVGGGLAGAGALLFDPLGEALDERLAHSRRPALVPAVHGDGAAMVGAALLAERALLADRTLPADRMLPAERASVGTTAGGAA